METAIKRVRFFDGQFLKEIDFQDEQRYHQHLRRRMNFLLFGGSGVVALSPSDLTLQLVSLADKTFLVRAGMAIGCNSAELEGREVLLLADSAPIDLDTSGIGAGQTATVAIHYQEQTAKDPPSEGDVDEDTRFEEQAVITVHSGAPPATTAAGDPYIVLGTVAYDTMTLGVTGRMLAQIRASLIGAAPLPTVTSITPSTGVQGSTFTATITGTHLTGAILVKFSDPGITVSSFTVVDDGHVQVTVSVGATVAAGGYTVTVTPTAGSGTSAANLFTVTAAVPTITSVTGATVIANGVATPGVVINGTHLAGMTLTIPTQPGISVTSPVVTDTTVTVTLTAALGTAGSYPFVLTPTTGPLVNSPAGVTVNVQAPVPTITAISLHSATKPSVHAGVTITGTNFTGVSAIAFFVATTDLATSNVTASAISVNGAGTQLTLTVTVAAGADSVAYYFKVTTVAVTGSSKGVAGAAFSVL